MTAMTIVFVVGVLLIAIGGRMSKRRIRSTFGKVDSTSIQLSEGTGVVPRWVSMLVLLGWLGVVGGVLGVVIAAVG